jgi:ketosteroid isomerase-like protein
MSQENLERVRRVCAEWERGNMAAGVELFQPEIVFQSFMPDSSETVVAHGPEEVARFMREFLAQWRDYRLIAEDIRDAGDKVFVAGRQAAHGKYSGVEVEDPMYWVWTFHSGRASGLRFTRSRQEALEEAGLQE